jgi:hypothetical protein
MLQLCNVSSPMDRSDEWSSNVFSHTTVRRLCCKIRRAQRRTEPDTLYSRYTVNFILQPVVDISVHPIRRKKAEDMKTHRRSIFNPPLTTNGRIWRGSISTLGRPPLHGYTTIPNSVQRLALTPAHMNEFCGFFLSSPICHNLSRI